MAFFTVIWRIENFSMCPHQVGEVLLSPEFTIPELTNEKWKIQLFPRGDECVTDGDSVSCYLYRFQAKDQNPDIITLKNICFVVSSKLSLVSIGDSFKVDKKHGTGYRKLCSRKKIYEDLNGFLPNDVLTLQIHVCPKLGENNPPAKPDVEKLFSSSIPNTTFSARECFLKENEEKDVFLTHCSFTTRIPVEQRILTWSIEEFNAKRKSKEKMSLILGSEFHDGVKLFLVCYVEGSDEENESLRIDISRKGADFRRTFVKCDASFLDNSDVVQCSKTSEHVFADTYKRWTFPLIDRLDNAMKNDSFIKLKFDFRISYESQNVKHLTKSNFSKESCFLDKIKNMLDHEETSDVSFECKSGKKFPAHKFLMCALSPVFRAMFSSDTQEKQTGVVKMLDTDTDTVRQLRDYLYSDSLPHDLEVEDVLKLYTVADKYDIRTLKCECEGYLSSNITADNVCEIVTLAEMHNDNNLKDYANEFLIAEMDFDSVLWKTFTKENPVLSAETMRKCLLKTRKITHKIDA